MTDWQPMDTAPKDGTRISLVVYQTGQAPDLNFERIVVTGGYWDADAGAWYISEHVHVPDPQFWLPSSLPSE